MQAIAGFCMLLFVATVTLVGVRMLLLARRTHGSPELLMGAGMVLVGAVGFPGGLLSGFGRGSVESLSLPIWVGATLVTQIGILLIYAFTQQVFRPGVAWARAVVAAGAAFMLAGGIGAGAALAAAEPGASSQEVARDWLFVSIVGYASCFLWSAVEGLAHFRMARRRMALGLADPVVANRFLLWGIFGLFASAVNVSSAIGNGLGFAPDAPAVLVPMGVFGFGASAAMYLAFVPPGWYLLRLRRPAST